jgi:hypothetical protein
MLYAIQHDKPLLLGLGGMANPHDAASQKVT